MRKVLTAAVVLAAGLVACGPRRIPGTDIADTDENEAVMKVVAQYKDAFDNRDAPAILSLVSPHFYETNGTPDASDDYDFNGLRKMLASELAKTSGNALDIDVRSIEVKGDDATVDYYYTERFQLADAGYNAGFKSASDVAQIRLHREGGTWKITGGI